jgi:hypothetical protein
VTPMNIVHLIAGFVVFVVVFIISQVSPDAILPLAMLCIVVGLGLIGIAMVWVRLRLSNRSRSEHDATLR